MAKERVLRDEKPQRVQTSGSITYLLYPAAGVTSLATVGWSVLRIDETDPDDIIIQWSGGNRIKQYAANSLSSLTYSNIAQ
jgi:ABC-type Fe3+-hydroxamate transport system substrate-binding protein